MRNISFTFLGVSTLILLLLDAYIYWAMRWYILQNGLSEKWFSRIYWSLSFVSFAIFWFAAFKGRNFAGQPASTFLSSFAFIFLLSKLFCIVILLVADFIRLSGFLVEKAFTTQKMLSGRSKFLHAFAAGLALIPFSTLWYGILRNPYRYKLHKIKLKVRNLAPELDGFKMVQVSDIHSGSFTFKEPIKNGLKMIEECNPDVVFFTGDLVNTLANEVDPYLDIFKEIKSKNGVISILGNHDYGDYKQWDSPEEKLGNFNELKSKHRYLGWDLLLNESRVIKHKGKSIGIIGVENYSALPQFPKYGDLSLATSKLPEVDFKILLSHDPSHWEYAVVDQYQDIQLTLSGHTHGFQFGIEIPGWFQWSPIKYAYKQWAGLYQKGDQALYVNRGFGFLGYPGRVGILPEITEITLCTA